MYMKFYQLKKEPFHITPDPDFFYLSSSHKEAFASVMYGVENRKGFMAVLGEVGTGKTTVIRSYLMQQARKNFKPIYLFNSNITFEELVRIILKEFRIDPADRSLSEMVQRLHWALFNAYKQGINVAVFIDEAQNMPVSTLENLRMLSNLETHKEKLIQIVLIGQPELNDKLSLHKLRQLDQRIVFRAHIAPLSKEESFEYLYYRLGQAALVPSRVFTEKALECIIKRAGGIPRVLNILCDNALIAGYALEEKPVSVETVKQVIREFDERKNRSGWSLRGAAITKAAACVAVVAMGAVLAWSLLGRGPAVEARNELASSRPSISEIGAPEAPLSVRKAPAVASLPPMSELASPLDSSAVHEAQPDSAVDRGARRFAGGPTMGRDPNTRDYAVN